MNQAKPMPDPPDARRNFWLTVGNGSVVVMGMAFFAPPTVLAELSKTLTDSDLLVGLMVSAGAVGFMWPQLFVGSLVEHLPRKKHCYTAVAFARLALVLAMAAAAYLWRGSDLGLYWLVLTLYFAFSSAGGIVAVPFMDIVGKAIPKRHMPVLWAYRRMLGGFMGFAASLLVGWILSEKSGVSFPENYALSFFLGAIVCAVAYSLFVAVREPEGITVNQRVSFLKFLRRGPIIFRHDKDFRRFFIIRGLWAVGRMGQAALLVPMAKVYFGARPEVTAGWFTAVVLLVGGLSSYFWGKTAQRLGETKVMRTSSILLLLSPLTAAALGLLHLIPAASELASRIYLPMYFFMYACGTAGINGQDIATQVYLLALPPEHLRPTYVAFMNTLFVPFLLAPVAAGFMAGFVSYPVVFGVSCAALIIAYGMAGRLQHRSEATTLDLQFEE